MTSEEPTSYNMPLAQSKNVARVSEEHLINLSSLAMLELLLIVLPCETVSPSPTPVSLTPLPSPDKTEILYDFTYFP